MQNNKGREMKKKNPLQIQDATKRVNFGGHWYSQVRAVRINREKNRSTSIRSFRFLGFRICRKTRNDK